MVRQIVVEQSEDTLLPVLETMFNKINKVFALWVQLVLQTQTAQPSNVKATPKLLPAPKVLIEQQYMFTHVFQRTFDTLRHLVSYSQFSESKSLAYFRISLLMQLFHNSPQCDE